MRDKCPHCNGRGGAYAFVNRGPDISTHSVDWIECRTCNGAGRVGGDVAERVARGEAMRKARIARGETLMDASLRLGFSPAAISAAEHGRDTPEAQAVLARLAN